jgi:hypothetical protein
MLTRMLYGSILAIGLVFTITGCLKTEPTPSRDFEVRELLIELSVLPKGWYVSYPPQQYPEKRRQKDSAFIQFDAESPTLYIAQHSILMYHNKSGATFEYHKVAEEVFGEALLVKPWHVPTELRYESPIANQFRLACADSRIVDVRTICIAVAQYDEYISIFNAVIVPGFMTYADVERILKYIDDRMMRYLNKSAPSPAKSP